MDVVVVVPEPVEEVWTIEEVVSRAMVVRLVVPMVVVVWTPKLPFARCTKILCTALLIFFTEVTDR